jgi:hypothetical protein
MLCLLVFLDTKAFPIGVSRKIETFINIHTSYLFTVMISDSANCKIVF